MGFAFKDYTQVWAAMDGDLGDYVRGADRREGGARADGKALGPRLPPDHDSSKPIEKAADLAG